MTKDLLFIFFVLIMSCFFYTSTVQAQGNIGIIRVALNNDAVIVQELGKPIVINYVGPPPIDNNIHVRLFRGTLNVLRRQPADTQGCVSFNAAILRVTVGGAMQIQNLSDPRWLKPSSRGFSEEHYTLVFETGDEPSESNIRIHKRELDRYFKYAIQMTLRPPDSLRSALQDVLKDAVDYLQQRRDIFRNTPTSICWGVEFITDDNNLDIIKTTQVAKLVSCDTRNTIDTAKHEHKINQFNIYNTIVSIALSN